MKRGWLSASLALALAVAAPTAAQASPAHPLCADLGPTLGVGVSHFSDAGDWAEHAASDFGVQWSFAYWYEVPVDDPPDAQAAYTKGNVALADGLGAMPVFTFYELLELGQQAGIQGAEPDVVKAVLEDPAIMSDYFDRFIFLLQTVADQPEPVMVHVEPDSWGFMIWAMGVEGNADATSVPVMVKSSGHPDVAMFPDHAGGLGQALLKLRNQYAPKVRLGWHASNFRTGTGGDIVASFYSSMGEWDALVSEHPHVEGDPSTWWLPWDDAAVKTNLGFFSTLTQAAHVPMLLWQEQIGTTDFHLFGDDATMLPRFAKAGIGGVLFSMRGSGDPDLFRADEDPSLATVPPAATMAGGTAADMRARLAAYTQHPLAWPAGSICDAATSGAGGAAATGTSGTTGGAHNAGNAASGTGAGNSSEQAGSGGSSGATTPPNGDTAGDTGGCGCAVPGTTHGEAGLLAFVIGALALRRRSTKDLLSRSA